MNMIIIIDNPLGKTVRLIKIQNVGIEDFMAGHIGSCHLLWHKYYGGGKRNVRVNE